MNDFYENTVSSYDVVKLLFEMKKDRHAERVLELIGELRLLQGKLEAFYENKDKL